MAERSECETRQPGFKSMLTKKLFKVILNLTPANWTKRNLLKWCPLILSRGRVSVSLYPSMALSSVALAGVYFIFLQQVLEPFLIDFTIQTTL